uniref:HRAS-like suppressor 3 n=1 Tax=Crassostrea virginica TaxID=6565 RepID=A0A8B8ENC3_CRAVI|nr:HRAS-like suppressor 3 [Crassostrea virginica]
MSVQDVVKKAKRGDLLEIPRARGLYSHWVMYTGCGKVLHIGSQPSVLKNGFRGFLGSFFKKTVVRSDKLSEIVGNSSVYIKNALDSKYVPLAMKNMKEAFEMVGKEGYSFLFGNCETIANFGRYGQPVSFQAVFALELLMTIGAGFVVGAIIKELLEEKIGFKMAMFAGVCTGAITTVWLMLKIHGSIVTDFLAMCVTKISELVMLKAIPATVTNFLTITTVVLVSYGLYRLVTSDTFKKCVRRVADGISRLTERFCDFIGSLTEGIRGCFSSSNAIKN